VSPPPEMPPTFVPVAARNRSGNPAPPDPSEWQEHRDCVHTRYPRIRDRSDTADRTGINPECRPRNNRTQKQKKSQPNSSAEAQAIPMQQLRIDNMHALLIG